MDIVLSVVLIWLAMLFVMLAFIRGAALQEREAVKLDEAFANVKRAIDPLAGLRS
ncbi:MAG: hypothetical protein JWR07_282 [Nevskia sp.]|nr:hypothetical protein [Nevskia sp.]